MGDPMLEFLYTVPQIFNVPPIFAPLSGLIEKLVLQMDLIDLVLWFPNLSWREFGTSLAAIVSWKLIADQIEEIAMNRLRVWLADALMVLAGAVRPHA